jgi:nucleotide-binding universal stress UspA family protein
MYKRILVAIDLNDEAGWHGPLVTAVEHARKFGAELIVLTVVREVEAIIYAKTGPFAYSMIAADLERQLSARVDEVGGDDLHPKIIVTHGETIYGEILRVAEEAQSDMIVVGSHRPAMKDYLLGTNAGRVVRHARCSVLVARE